MYRLMLILAGLITVIPVPSLAVVSFTPFHCTSCQSHYFSYSAHGTDYTNFTNWELEMAPETTSTHYANSLHHTRYLASSAYAKDMYPNSTFFSSEYSWDIMTFRVGTTQQYWLSGDYGTPPGEIHLSASQSFQASAGSIDFESDRTVNDEGFSFSGMRICCTSTPATGPLSIDYMQRVHGFLLGTNDVIYFSLPSDPSSHLVLNLWGDGQTSTSDFDLYVACGTNPTPSSSDYSSLADGRTETIHIPAGYCQSGQIRVAVHSYRLATETPLHGGFNFYATKHLPGRHFQHVKVGVIPFPPPLTDTQRSWAQWDLKVAAAYTYGATEGALFYESFDVYPSAGCQDANGVPQTNCYSYFLQHPDDVLYCTCGTSVCDICLPYFPGTNNANGRAVLCGGLSTPSRFDLYDYDARSSTQQFPRIFAHEAIHAKFCANDEYQPSPIQTKCGHTILNSLSTGRALHNTNLCFKQASQPYHCNHAWDADIPPGGNFDESTCTLMPGAWDQATSAGVVPTGYYPPETPDAYSFIEPEVYDFGSLLGVSTFIN